MRRSKLEMAIDILKILAQKGPLKLTHIMYKTNVNCDVLNKNLGFLMKHGLIEVRNLGRRRHVYAITALGLTLLKSWKEVKQLLPANVGKEEGLPLLYRNAVTIKA
jgi:predicted transcriptional regulator